MREANEQAVAPIDRAYDPALNRDGRAGDPLENNAHELSGGTGANRRQADAINCNCCGRQREAYANWGEDFVALTIYLFGSSMAPHLTSHGASYFTAC